MSSRHRQTERQVDRYSLEEYWSHTFTTNKSAGMFSPTRLWEYFHSGLEPADGLNLYQICRQLKHVNWINSNQHTGHTSINVIDIPSKKRYGRPRIYTTEIIQKEMRSFHVTLHHEMTCHITLEKCSQWHILQNAIIYFLLLP